MQAEIKGSTMPTLEVSLQQGEAVITPHGELAWMTTTIRMSQTMNAVSVPVQYPHTNPFSGAPAS